MRFVVCSTVNELKQCEKSSDALDQGKALSRPRWMLEFRLEAACGLGRRKVSATIGNVTCVGASATRNAGVPRAILNVTFVYCVHLTYCLQQIIRSFA